MTSTYSMTRGFLNDMVLNNLCGMIWRDFDDNHGMILRVLKDLHGMFRNVLNDIYGMSMEEF